MSERSEWIDKLRNSFTSRVAYTRATINVNVGSQVRSLRRQRDNMTQKALANESDMKQSRISAIEHPGDSSFNIETLVRIASAFKVGLMVRFVPYSEMLRWENSFRPDSFDITPIDEDFEFVEPQGVVDLLRRAKKPNIIEAALEEHHRHSPLADILGRETHKQPRQISVSGLMGMGTQTTLNSGTGGR